MCLCRPASLPFFPYYCGFLESCLCKWGGVGGRECCGTVEFANIVLSEKACLQAELWHQQQTEVVGKRRVEKSGVRKACKYTKDNMVKIPSPALEHTAPMPYCKILCSRSVRQTLHPDNPLCQIASRKGCGKMLDTTAAAVEDLFFPVAG